MNKQGVNETREQAEARFAEIRHSVYRQIEDELRDQNINVNFRKITHDAAERAHRWQYPSHLQHRVPGWNWLKEVKSFQRRPKRVEAAIWDGSGPNSLLCGLVLGRVSRNKVCASIHYLESNPERETPLSGIFAQIATRYLELQAAALGCKELSINKPHPDLLDFYDELGFKRRVTKGRTVVRVERLLDLRQLDRRQ